MFDLDGSDEIDRRVSFNQVVGGCTCIIDGI
jgi:hypothetical protein